jgi:hypothetical protein
MSECTVAVSVRVPPDWLTPLVVSLAQAAYDDRPGRKCERCGRLGDRPGEYTPDDGWNIPEKCKSCHGTGRVEDGLLCPDRLAVLADALLDAGCPEDAECPQCGGAGRYWYAGFRGPRTTLLKCETCGDGGDPGIGDPYRGTGRVPHPLLAHLRSPGPHVRGCWALDLILGEE